MNVLAVCNLFPPHHAGGYGLQMGLFCDGLAARGHRVTVLTSRPAGGGADDGGTAAVGVRRELALLPAAAGPGGVVWAARANRAAVRRAVRRVRPDVVLCGGMDGVGFNTYQAAITSGVPSLTWLGDTWLSQAWQDLPRFDPYTDLALGGRRPGPLRWAKWAAGRLGRLAGLSAARRPAVFAPVACISTFVAAELARAAAVPEPPVVPITLAPGFFRPDGAAVGRDGTTARHLRALFVGRMEHLKGPDLAVDAVAAAVAAGADVRLTLAGLHQERLRPVLEPRAAAAGVADRVAWAGTPDPTGLVRLYRSHDVFLFPSRIVEGLGVVNCEALACGLPVVGTADSGAADVILDGRTGFRVPQNDPAAIARHLTALHADRPRLDALSASAAGFARRFHPDAVVGQLERELARAAAGGRP